MLCLVILRREHVCVAGPLLPLQPSYCLLVFSLQPRSPRKSPATQRPLRRAPSSLLFPCHIFNSNHTYLVVKDIVFPVVMYGCESWTVKKAELQRIDAFELWCWRRLLRVPWTARRSNQSILKEISSGCSLEGLMLKLKLQYFDHLMLSHWKRL